MLLAKGKLQKIQKKAARIAYRKPTHTRITTDLHEIASIEPIREERFDTISGVSRNKLRGVL